jgi:hypothetical protein
MGQVVRAHGARWVSYAALLGLAALVAACGTPAPSIQTASPAATGVQVAAGSPGPSGGSSPGPSADPSAGPSAGPSGPPLVEVPGEPSGPPPTPGPETVTIRSSPSGAVLGVEPEPGIRIGDLRAVSDAGAAPPDGTSLPFGAISFTLDGLAPGAATSVTLHLPSGAAEPATYLRYGPEPGRPDPHWYDFSWDLETGAERLGGGVIVLHFIDGSRGDDDLAANGRIVDAGGAAQTGNQPPDPSLTWRYGRYEPMTVHLTSTATDPDGPITETRWLLPDGRIATGTAVSWDAPSGPGGTMWRFVLAVSDGTTWSTREVYIAVPPAMRLSCGSTKDVSNYTPEERVVSFHGSSNYWFTYGWSTNRGPNHGLGDYDEIAVWYEWDPGDGGPPIPGRTRDIHQDDFNADYGYGGGPGTPTHFTATLRAGTFKTGTGVKVELATCQTEVQFPMPVYDLAGTITIDRTKDFYRDGSTRSTETETLHATVQVAMRTDPNDPTGFVDAGSTFTVNRKAATEVSNLGDCSPTRYTYTSAGSYYFTEPADPPDDASPGAPTPEPTADVVGTSSIFGFQDRTRGLVTIGMVAGYPYTTQVTCAIAGSNPFDPPEVADGWACGDQFFGSQGIGIEGTIIDAPSGPDTVVVDCTFEGPDPFGNFMGTQRITATGTLTITGQ